MRVKPLLLLLSVTSLCSKPNCSGGDSKCQHRYGSEEIRTKYLTPLGNKGVENEPRDNCPVVGTLNIVLDTPIPADGSDEDRAEITLPPGLEFRKSSLKNAKLGVWTTQFFPSRTRFGPYEGEIITRYGPSGPNTHSWEIKKNGKDLYWVDGTDRTKANWLRYVNPARTDTEQNLVTWQDGDHIYYYTYRDVVPGEELLAWFGDYYAENLGIHRPGWCWNIKFDEACWPFFYQCPRGSCLIDICHDNEGVVEQEQEDQFLRDQQAVGYSRMAGYMDYDYPIFEPLNIVRDLKLPMDGSIQDRAERTLPPGLSIRTSTIEGAGLGVFAEEDIPSRTRFGPYEGFPVYDVDAERDNTYSWKVYENTDREHLVDAKDPSRSNWLRYVNTADYIDSQNLNVVQLRGLRYYYSFRRIPAGTELLTWYGYSYDEYLGITTRHQFSWNHIHNEACWPFFFTCPKGSCINKMCPLRK
ncbi:uncharacterized protein LOC121386784 isoform X2 [Gigantopelta aegis]|uniref:uncharacterized protein LOC121386784 isoform X2 n=1 Tax=Gigantopelta aegis TaxID=1735272 RepID=UPI001B88E767|nr:uncharacterized protein LOC121386784 isoform X2 [Gigantopelta aegis]